MNVTFLGEMKLTTMDMMETARIAIESFEAEGFLIMASKSGTSFLLQSPETSAPLDESGHDARSRFISRLEADREFRAAVKAFILAERPYGGGAGTT